MDPRAVALQIYLDPRAVVNNLAVWSGKEVTRIEDRWQENVEK